MGDLNDIKVKAFLNRIKTEWPGFVERFEFKTASVIYVYLKKGISSGEFLITLAIKIERFVDFSNPIILYHIDSDGMSLKSHPINWYSSLNGSSFKK